MLLGRPTKIIESFVLLFKLQKATYLTFCATVQLKKVQAPHEIILWYWVLSSLLKSKDLTQAFCSIPQLTNVYSPHTIILRCCPTYKCSQTSHNLAIFSILEVKSTDIAEPLRAIQPP